MTISSDGLQMLWLTVIEQLQQFLAASDLVNELHLAFGEGLNQQLAINFIQTVINGEARPEIEVRPAADLDGAKGAFSSSTGTVYLAEEFVSNHSIETIAEVLLEELGHFLDWQLNEVDSSGDEGAIFAALVQGETLETRKLQQLKAEDDTAFVDLDGTTIAIEQNTDAEPETGDGGMSTSEDVGEDAVSALTAADILGEIDDLKTGLGSVLANAGEVFQSIEDGIRQLSNFQDAVNEKVGSTKLPLLGEVADLSSAPLELVTEIRDAILDQLGEVVDDVLQPAKETLATILGAFFDVSAVSDAQIIELLEKLLDEAIAVDLTNPNQDQIAADFLAAIKDDFFATFPEIDPNSLGLDAAIEDFVTELSNRLVDELNGILGTPLGPIRQAIFDAIGPDGIDILKDIDGNSVVDVEDVEVNITEVEQLQDLETLDIEFDLRLGKEEAITTSLATDVGIPGLGLAIEGDAQVDTGFDWELGFGTNLTDVFYFDTASNNEIEIGLDASTPGLEASGRLGFLQLGVTDGEDDSLPDNSPPLAAGFEVNITDPNNDGKLTLAEIFQAEFDTTLDLTADIDLKFDAGLSADAQFPSITTDFNFDWDFVDQVDPDNPQNLGNKPTIGFNNVTLDLGSFFGNFVTPILDTVQTITEPIEPIVDVLTEDIDLKLMKFSLLDLAEELGYVDQNERDFIESIAQLIDVINSIPEGGSTGLNLGGFDFGEFDIRGLNFDLGQVNPNISQPFDVNTEIPANSPEAEFIAEINKVPGAGLQFPLLTDPLKAFGLLLGKDADLFTYDLPRFDFTLGYSQFFPIVGPFGIRLGGDVGAALSLPGFGYDTVGLRQFAEGADGNSGTADDFSDAGQVFDGFYVIDTEELDGTITDIPEVGLTGGLEASAELNAGVVSAGAGGGLYAGVDFDLNDPNDDGKVRTSEFATLLQNPLCLFDVHGDLAARLYAYFKVGAGLFSITQRFDSPNLVLLDFNHGCDGSRDSNDPNPPTLATQNGKVLTLNMAGEDEAFTVEHVKGTSNDETLFVYAFGAREEHAGISQIVADGKGGNDYIALGDGVLAPADLAGNSGDDLIIAGSGNDTLSGDGGVDRLEGGEGQDDLAGGRNDDFLIGGKGADTLDGGSGDDTASYTTAEAGVRVNLINPSQNTGDAAGDSYQSIEKIEGSLHDDTLIGEDKNPIGAKGDSLAGLNGADVLEGRNGDDSLEGGAGKDILRGGNQNDILAGGADADVLDGGEGDDIATYADSTKGIVLNLQDPSQSTGHAQGDTFTSIEIFEGSYHNDILQGNGQEDQFLGLDGNDVLRGGGGGDDLDGGEGYDIASYEDSPVGLEVNLDKPSESTGYAAGDTYKNIEEIQGSAFNDTLVGNGKDNILDGLEGHNVLIGGNGLVGNSADDLRAGTGNDTYSLNANKSEGSIIRDRGGDYDLLLLDNTTLVLADPSPGSTGLARKHNDLIIDTNEDGTANRSDDLTIENFFSPRNIAVSDVTQLEGDGGLTEASFTVTAQGANSGAGIGFIETLMNLRGVDVLERFNTVEVDYTTAEGTATEADQDYKPTNGTLSFAPDETAKTVSVSIVGDLKAEDDEFFTLDVSTDNTNIAKASGRGTIANDDTAIAIEDQLVVEGDDGPTTATVTVSLSQASQETVTVDYTTQPQTAAGNSDYGQTSGTLTFNPGETEKTIAVDVLGDVHNELDETFLVQLSNASNGDLADDQATVTILNNDFADITVDDFTVVEGDSGAVTGNFTVTLAAASPHQVSVEYSTFNDTAIAGLDYVPKSGFLTFQPGATSQTIAVDIIGENRIEANEKFSLELSNSINGTIADGRGVGTIRNDDALEIAINEIIVSEGDSGNTHAIFTVELSDAVDEPVTVDYGTANGTAIADTDYVSTNGTLSFAPGETAKTITVEVVGDTEIEGDEAFFINLSDASDGVITTPQTVGTLRDDDFPTIAIADVALDEGDSGLSFADVTVSLSAPSENEVTVAYRTEAGTARANLDYGAVAGDITFAPGEVEKTILIPVNGETLIEADETFAVVLSDPRNGELVDTEGDVTIKNDDFAAIAITDASVFEYQDGPVLNVTLSAAIESQVTVEYTTVDDSAKAAADYVATSGTLIFEPGETEQTLYVPLVDDAIPEETERFRVNLFNPSSNAVLADDQAIVVVEDDDVDPPVAWWRLDDGVGIIASEEIEKNDGELQNGPTWITGPVNEALSFDGSDDFVSVTDDDALDFATGDFSMSTWARVSSDDFGVLLDKRVTTPGGPFQGYVLSHNNGQLRFDMADGVGGVATYLSSVNIADQQWHHLTISVDRDTPNGGVFYVDGVAIGGFDPTGAQGSLSNAQALTMAGPSASANPDAYLFGQLDEVKLFKTALNAAEVFSLYEDAAAGSNTPNPLDRDIKGDTLADAVAPELDVAAASSASAATAAAKSTAGSETAEEPPLPVAFLSGANSSEPDSSESTQAAAVTTNNSSGEIKGQIWYDQNNSSTQEAFEPGLAGWVVFLDANQNATFDADEPFTVTDAAGNYAFTNLEAGAYTIAQVHHDGWVQTYPDTDINGDFESGTFDDWLPVGDYRIEPSAADAPYSLGNFQAEITTDQGAVAASALETFLGLGNGSLDDLLANLSNSFPEDENLRTNVTEGSAIAKTITVEAGDVLTFDWNFLTFDYKPYIDFAFFSISSPTTEVLASVQSPLEVSPASVLEETGFGTFSHTFTDSGTFTVGVGVVDVGDQVVDSALLVDNFMLIAKYYSVELQAGENIDSLNFGNYLPGLPQTIQFAAATYSVTGEDTTAEVTLTRSGDVGTAAKVTVQLSDGTAHGGSDFDATDQIVNFAPGEVSKTVAISILEDVLAESDESFFLNLTAPNGAEIGAQSTATVIIEDTDTVVSFAQPTYQISEAGTPIGAEITVLRTGDLSSSSEVELFFEADTATGGSPFIEFGEDPDGNTTHTLMFPEGVDFDHSKIESSGSVTNTRTVFFEPGQETQTVTFPIHDDGIREGSEFFNLYLLNTGDPATGAYKKAQIEIIDNEDVEITGSVWHDLNEDGTWNIGEFGLSDRTVYIDANNNQTLDPGETSTLTDAAGAFSFAGLKQGTYTIAEILSDDWQQTYPGTTANFVHTVAAEPGEHVNPINFGSFNNQLGGIQGYKWHDRDRDGIWEQGEETLPGWIIYLDNNDNGALDPGEFTTVTDAKGAYSFTGLAPGNYQVGEMMRPNWQQSYPFLNAAGNSTHPVTVNPGKVTSQVDFGNFYTGADPVAWWRLDETAGAIAEDSVADNDGELKNGPTWIQQGAVNGALGFDNVDDYVEVADDDALDFGIGDFSVSTWVKIVDGVGTILDKRTATSGSVQGYGLFHDNDSIGFQLADGVGGGVVSYVQPAGLADGEWHHITVTVDRDETNGGELYVDGIKEGTFDPTGEQGSLSNSQNLLMGRRSNTPADPYFWGALDEVKLFKTALSEEAVLSLYENNRAIGVGTGVDTQDPVTGLEPVDGQPGGVIVGNPDKDELIRGTSEKVSVSSQDVGDAGAVTDVMSNIDAIESTESNAMGLSTVTPVDSNNLLDAGSDPLSLNLGNSGSEQVLAGLQAV
ncbi:MAG: Calx-beta domain-containing protein [Leptolyngbyaceae cyanobacterium]